MEAQDPRNYVGFPGGYVAPRSCFFAPRNGTKVSRSNRAPRAKMCIPKAGRAVNKNVTDFVRVGMDSLQVTYDVLGLCDSWAAHMFPKSAFEVFTTSKVDGYLCRAGRQLSHICYI